MSDEQNLAYAAVQVAHNFGAAATMGGTFAAMHAPAEARRTLAWIVLAGWTTQAVSGPAFGVVSYYFDRHFPDIGGIAIVALAIKIICVAIGFLLAAAYLLPCPVCRERIGNWIWPASTALAATALTAAAFLRWFA